MTKKRRVYRPRFVGGKIMMQADLERLHKYTIGCRGHRRGRQLKAATRLTFVCFGRNALDHRCGGWRRL